MVSVMRRRCATLLAVAAFIAPRAARATEENSCSAAHVRAQLLKRDAPDKLLARRDALRTCSSTLCAPSIVDACSVWLREVDPVVPSLVVRVVDARGIPVANASIRIDGTAQAVGLPVDVDPGEHTVVAVAATTESHTVVVHSGEKRRSIQIVAGAPKSVATAPPKVAVEESSNWPAYTAAGISALSLTTAAVFGGLWADARSGTQGCLVPESCPATFDIDAANRDVRGYAIGFWISVSVALLSGGWAAVSLLRSDTASNARTSATREPRPARYLRFGATGIQGTFQ